MEHKHHGKSSAKFLDSDEILSELDLKGDEVFMVRKGMEIGKGMSSWETEFVLW